MAIFALIGQSASGKSTIERRLEEMGFPRIISHTTRPMRSGEVHGVDYHFVTEERFEELFKQGFFQETAKYREWWYGLSLSGVNYKEEDYVVVVTIHGYEEIINAIGKEHVKGIHIHVPERERIIRQLYRGDDVDEVFRRIYTDRIDFKRAVDVCDFVITNDDLELSVYTVKTIIEEYGSR